MNGREASGRGPGRGFGAWRGPDLGIESAEARVWTVDPWLRARDWQGDREPAGSLDRPVARMEVCSEKVPSGQSELAGPE